MNESEMTKALLSAGIMNQRLREAGESAEDWMESGGCDCGTDERCSCGLCLTADALALKPEDAEKQAEALLELLEAARKDGCPKPMSDWVQRVRYIANHTCRELGIE